MISSVNHQNKFLNYTRRLFNLPFNEVVLFLKEIVNPGRIFENIGKTQAAPKGYNDFLIE